MKKSTIGVLVGLFLLFVVIPASLFNSYVNHHDEAVDYEKRIEAQYDKDINALSKVSLSALELMQVADAERDDAIAILNAAMRGKYGDSGATSDFLWSADSPLGGVRDSSIRKQVANIIAGGRTNFEQSQNVRIDICRGYKTKTDQFWSGLMYSLAKFPKIDVKEMCTPVSSSHAQRAFETKTDNGLNLYNGNK